MTITLSDGQELEVKRNDLPDQLSKDGNRIRIWDD
jgi:hypothetical protein